MIPSGIWSNLGVMAAQALGQAAATFSQARGSFTCSAGTCVGETPETIGIFAGLQRALNVLAAVAGAPDLQVGVDGKIGNKTLIASQKALTLFFPKQPIPQDAMTLAQQAKTTAEMFAARANTKPNFTAPSGAAIQPATPPSPTGPLPEPLPPEGPAVPGIRTGLHWGWWVGGAVLLAGAGYLGYRMFSGKPVFGGADDDYEDVDHGYGEAGKDFIDV